jgi:outer membrane protein TolC
MMRQIGIVVVLLLMLLGSAAEAGEGSGFTELRLTRAELLAALSAQNPAVAEAMSAVREAEIAEQALEARWSWGVQASVGYDQNESYPGGSGRGELSTDGLGRWSMGLAKALPWGTTMALTMGQVRRTQSVPCSTGSEEGLYIPCLFFGADKSLTQPLLKGAGRGVSEVVERQAALEREARRKSASGLVARASLEALTLYARWVAANAELTDLRASLERSKRLTEMAKALVTADQLAEVEVASFEVRELSLREALMTAEESIELIGSGLAATIGAPPGALVVPIEPLRSWLPPTEGADALCAEAVAVDPRLQELAMRRQQAELAVETAREEGRPSLDLTGSLSPSGTSDGWGGSLSDAAAMEARGYGAALTLTMPLDNLAADARLEQSRLVGERLRRQQAALEDTVCREVRVGRERLATMGTRRALAALRIEQTARLLTAREAKFEAGYGTMDELFAALEGHEQSRAAERRIAAEEEAAQLQLLAARGRLLSAFAEAPVATGASAP